MKKGFSAWGIVAAIAFAGVAIGIGVFASGYLQESNITITVKDKERIVDRNDHERYQEFIGAVNKGEKKVNTSTVTTAEVIQNVKKGDNNSANAIWKSLDNFVPEDLNAIVVADVSGSMYGRPMEISTSLALYFAERNKGYFANKFLTFSERPQLVEVLGETLTQKLRNIKMADWGMNTNIERTFDALLAAAVASGDTENIPRVIYIISDMEFDQCATGADETAFENAKRKWNEAGLELPTVVFLECRCSL